VAGLPPPPDPSSGFLDLLTVYAAPGLRGLVSCRLRPWDSPYRAFPFQGIRAPSEAVAPLRLGARLLLPPSFPADSSRTITHGRVEAGPPREGPLRLAVPRRRWSRGCPSISPAPHPHPAWPPHRGALSGRGQKPVEHGIGPDGATGFLPECGAPPLRSVAPPGSPFSSPSGVPRTTVDALLGFVPL
jgi:hypothetical protein